MAAAPDVVIRRAVPGDVDVLLALQEEAFGADPFCLTRAGFEAFCSSRHIDVLVAGREAALWGYSVLHRRPLRPWTSLDFIAVSANARRAGIGSALMAAALPKVRRRSLRLFVRADNHAAISFYEKHGFTRLGLHRRHYADGRDALSMMRRMR